MKTADETISEIVAQTTDDNPNKRISKSVALDKLLELIPKTEAKQHKCEACQL